MEKQYEIPNLVLVGRVNEVVFGPPGAGHDGDWGSAIGEFEYEQDEWPMARPMPTAIG